MEKLLNDYKISFTKGDTYALAVKFKNITSDLGSAYFTVKENADDEPLLQKSLGSGVTKIDDRSYKQEKTYKIQLQSEDTVNLEPLVQYLYDFRVAFGNVVQTILSGVFVVKHSISDVSTTSTTTLDVTLSDVLESDVSTTPATQGIEYEQDPVACTKIGDLSALSTTNKETIVKAINEVNTDKNNVKIAVDNILDGKTAVPKATSAETAKTATTAQYASEDTSKGTIEDRLTKLGFKEGNTTLNISSNSVTHNYWKRQGNYVFGKVYFSCNHQPFSSGDKIFTIPTNARPAESIQFVVRVSVEDNQYKTYTLPATATIGANGICTIVFDTTYWFGDYYVSRGALQYLSEFKIDFGFEAKPIT